MRLPSASVADTVDQGLYAEVGEAVAAKSHLMSTFASAHYRVNDPAPYATTTLAMQNRIRTLVRTQFWQNSRPRQFLFRFRKPKLIRKRKVNSENHATLLLCRMEIRSYQSRKTILWTSWELQCHLVMLQLRRNVPFHLLEAKIVVIYLCQIGRKSFRHHHSNSLHQFQLRLQQPHRQILRQETISWGNRCVKVEKFFLSR